MAETRASRSLQSPAGAVGTLADLPDSLRRSCKVLAHEIGHMFGLSHCVFFHCLMNGSNSLAESVIDSNGKTKPLTRWRHTMNNADKQAAISALNQILELELAGVVRYTHYSLMVYGYNRIPIVSWLKGNAEEGLTHAQRAGEMVTLLGGHPSLKIGALLETEKHDVGDILRESLEHEQTALAAYYGLLKIAEGKSVLLEEYAREMIVQEELHLDEVNKMLRRPGAIDPFKG
jgi:bacterioferritin